MFEVRILYFARGIPRFAHWVAPKPMFPPTRFPNETQSATSKQMFWERVLSIFITCHKMPCLPREVHAVTTWRSPDTAICETNNMTTSGALPLPRNMMAEVSKLNIVWNTVLVTQAGSCHVFKHVALPFPVCAAVYKDLTGTAANSCERLQMVAGACGCLRTVANGCATSSEHTITRKPPE